MKLPTLYSRASTGAVRHWTIEVDGAKYRTIYGQEGGKTVVTEWYPALPTNVGRANARTGEEQAIFEAQAVWTRNKDLGYFESKKDIDKPLAHVECMLAHKLRDNPVDFTSGNWGIQNKWNGVRNLASIRGHLSRNGKLWVAIPHIVKSLEEFFSEYPEAVLDGELFNNDFRESLNELIKIVRKQKPSTQDLARSKELVKYYIYDGYGFAGMTESTPYHVRKAWIDKNIIGKYKHVEGVQTFHVKSEDDAMMKYFDFIEDGHEGGILRNMNSGYEHKRSRNLLKIKPEDDDEGQIISILEGKGNRAGTAMTCLIEWNSKQFEAIFTGSEEVRTGILKNQKAWIGKTVTFSFNGTTGLGKPNYAKVNPTNCFKGDR